MLSHDYFCLLVFLLCCRAFGVSFDPCDSKNHVVRRNEIWRSAGNIRQAGERSYCDRYLHTDWYRFISPAGNDMPTYCVQPNHCGTVWPIWFNGTLPATNQQITGSGCLYNIFAHNPCCYATYDIQVKNCNDKYNVYRLDGTNGCSQAYCIGTETPCPAGLMSLNGFSPGCADGYPNITNIPTMNWTIAPEKNCMNEGCKNGILFQCYPNLLEIPEDRHNNLTFNVAWYSDDVPFYEHSVTYQQLPATMNEIDFDRRFGVNFSCSIQAKYGQTGTPGYILKSRPFFAGFEIVTRLPLVLSEGDPEATALEFKPTLPVLCPLGFCGSLSVEIHIPKEQQVCNGFLEKSNQVVQEFTDTDCATTIPAIPSLEKWDPLKTYSIKVKASVDGMYDGNNILVIKLRTGSFLSHPAWENYDLPDVLVEVLDKDVEVAGIFCQVFNDPHMITFDGRYYECQFPGEHVLYKHKSLPLQVNAFFQSCSNNKKPPYCNCGVAVKSENDVFIIDYCRQTGIQGRIAMIGCERETMRIEQLQDGRFYKILLPTGGHVEVDVDLFNPGINHIHIYASTLDYINTLGLCGTLNFDETDDFHDRTGSQIANEQLFREAWRVLKGSKESLYTGTGETGRKGFPYCTCTEDRVANCGYVNNVQSCADEKQEITKAQYGRCRQRRDDPEGSDYILEERTFLEEDYDPSNISFTWKNGWTDESARAFCTSYIVDKTTGEAAALMENLDEGSLIDGCVADILMTGGTEWAEYTRDAFVATIATELAKNVSLWTVENGSSVAVPPAAIAVALCPRNCSGHGVCSNGTCICADTYYGFDCSMDINSAPVCLELPSAGLCDERSRPCRKSPVYCSSFIKSVAVTCKFKHFKVTNAGVVPSSAYSETTAEFIHLQEVMCPLPHTLSRKKRAASPTVPQETVLAEGYEVSVSNNAQNFSEPKYLLVYDSKCVDCNSTFSCSLKSETCIIGGMCYVVNETNPNNPCQRCDPAYDAVGWFTQATSCSIDGVCYPDGNIRPGVSCQYCDFNINENEWTVKNGSCLIEGTCHADRSTRPGYDCNVCDVSTNVYAWSLKTGSCYIEATCHANMATRPAYDCEVCDVATNVYVWSLKNNKCKINGTCYEPCELNPRNLSSVCHPDTDRSSWSPKEVCGQLTTSMVHPETTSMRTTSQSEGTSRHPITTVENSTTVDDIETTGNQMASGDPTTSGKLSTGVETFTSRQTRTPIPNDVLSSTTANAKETPTPTTENPHSLYWIIGAAGGGGVVIVVGIVASVCLCMRSQKIRRYRTKSRAKNKDATQGECEENRQ